MAAEENVVDEDSKTTGEEDSTTSFKTFTLEVLQIIKEAQQQHGLRHGDYQRYRGYCSRRVRRIRKALHFPQGSRNKVQPKKITEETLKDVRFLHIPLFCAERAWSYAMQLKEESNTENRKKYHMMSRIKKAVQYTEELVRLCESSKCDARTKLEAQAYNAWMKGSLQFELQNWKIAIEFYTNAKTIYEKLSGALTEDMHILYQQKVDEVAPNIRYCAYNIGDESAINDLMEMRIKSGQSQLSSRLDELLSQTREKQAATLSEVSWRGRVVPVKTEQVRVFLLNHQESVKQLVSAQDTDGKLSIFESLLKECIDAQQVLRETLQDDNNFKAAIRGQAIDGRTSNQHYLHTYVTFLRLSHTIDRNLLLIEQLKNYLPGKSTEEGRKVTKPQDLVKLYDNIIQNLTEIPNLCGLEDVSTLTDVNSTRALGYKSLRTFYIAQSYSAAKKWKEAIALYERVLDYASQAVTGYNAMKEKTDEIKAELVSIEDLIKQVDGLKYSCHASSILDTDNLFDQPVTTNMKNKPPLNERLQEYCEDSSLTSKHPNLVQFPPDFEPIPCRPLFFDLALNHLTFRSLEDKVEQKKTAGGLTGLVKGWLWGSKK